MIKPGVVMGWLVGTVAMAGCSAQADTAYQGEPMVTLRGQVVTGPVAAAADVEAAVLWVTAADRIAGLKLVGTQVPVRGTFPADFQLEVFTPPPPEGEVLIVGRSAEVAPVECPPAPHVCSDREEAPDERAGVWVGRIAALRPHVELGNILPSDLAGVDNEHVLLYFDRDAPDGNGFVGMFSRRYSVPATKGFHLGKVIVGTPEERAREIACYASGVCVHRMRSGDPWRQEENDTFFRQCVAAAPGAHTCEMFETEVLTQEEANAEAQCRQRAAEAQRDADCGLAQIGRPIANPAGFDDRVTVTLGQSFFE